MEPFEREDDKSKLLPEPPVEQESDCSDKTIRIIFALFEDCQQEETFVAIKILALVLGDKSPGTKVSNKKIKVPRCSE